jgi:hypothetical protein
VQAAGVVIYNPFSFIVTHPWAYPALEVVHIAGIALLVGNLVALEVRVWGGARGLDVQALARLSLTLAVIGFALAASRWNCSPTGHLSSSWG